MNAFTAVMISVCLVWAGMAYAEPCVDPAQSEKNAASKLVNADYSDACGEFVIIGKAGSYGCDAFFGFPGEFIDLTPRHERFVAKMSFTLNWDGKSIPDLSPLNKEISRLITAQERGLISISCKGPDMVFFSAGFPNMVKATEGLLR